MDCSDTSDCCHLSIFTGIPVLPYNMDCSDTSDCCHLSYLLGNWLELFCYYRVCSHTSSSSDSPCKDIRKTSVRDVHNITANKPMNNYIVSLVKTGSLSIVTLWIMLFGNSLLTVH